MRITVRIKPNSRKESVEQTGERSFVVRANAPAREGKANARVVELLGKHFDRPKSAVSIIKGLNSKNKVIDII